MVIETPGFHFNTFIPSGNSWIKDLVRINEDTGLERDSPLVEDSKLTWE